MVIGPWNFPVLLLLEPLAGAIAAGNAVFVKPSEVSSHTAKILSELIPKYLDTEAVVVVNGGALETGIILDEKFDHIFYTGGTAVGKVIMEKAAKYLTPVTLELGGKSPAIVSDDSDLDFVAQKLVLGRTMYAGQVCVCTDYVLCTQETKDKLLEKIPVILKAIYAEENIQDNANFARIVNKRHWNRVMGYLKNTKGKVVVGGQSDENDLYISPTVVVDVDDHEPLMTEEIFGPILPIRVVKDLQEAVAFVNARPHPLALYLFSRNKAEVNYVIENTLSGGVCVNDFMEHIINYDLPFGGVGDSGMGAYHGKHTFDTFSHIRSTLVRSQAKEFANNFSD